MGANSIKANLRKEEILTEIKLSINADMRKENMFIIVEGYDDIRFFTHKVANSVIIIESYSGKEGVKEIVTKANHASVIGICDLDYDTQLSLERIFYYDHCCLEMMLLADYKIYKNICAILAPGMIVGSEVVYNKLFQELKWLSNLRRISFMENLNINFRGLSIANAFNKNSNSLNIEKLKINLLKDNPEKEAIIEKAIDDVQTSLDDETTINDLLNITNGHDALYLMCCYFEHMESENTKDKYILQTLIAAYDFTQSKLYNTLNDYSKKIGRIIFEKSVA